MSPTELTAEAWLREAAQLRPLVRAVVRDDHLTEDVLQETWIAASKSEVVAELAQPARQSWLRTVARRLASRAVRRDRRSTEIEERAARPELLTPDERPEVLDELRTVIEELRGMSPLTREAVCLRYLDGLDPGEVAQRLECHPSTARVRVHRGLAELRDRLRARFGNGAPAAFGLLLRWSENGPRPPLVPGGSDPASGAAGAAGASASGAHWLGLAAGLAAIVALGLVALLRQGTDDGGPPAAADLGGLATGSGTAELAALRGAGAGEREGVAADAPVDAGTAGAADTVDVAIGVVYSETRTPIPGAELRGFIDLADGRSIPFDATTDLQGVTTLTVDAELTRAVSLEARAEGRATEYHLFRRQQLIGGPDRLRSVPMAQGSPVGGHVRDASGAPIAGARVAFERQRPGRLRSPHFPDAPDLVATTSADGSWSIGAVDLDGTLDEGRLGQLRIRVEHPDHAAFSAEVPRVGPLFNNITRRLRTQAFDVTLAPLDGQSLRVVDQNGAPVAGALVSGVRYVGRPIPHDVRARTDDAGRATIPSIARRQDLRIDAAGFATTLYTGGERIDGEWTVSLEPGQSMDGRIVDASGQPVAGALVRTHLWTDTLASDRPVESDADGAFRLVDLPDRSVRVLVEADQFVPLELDAVPGHGSLELVLGRETLIGGVVLDAAGKPIVGAQVEVADEAVGEWRLLRRPTDAEGRFAGRAMALGRGSTMVARAVAAGYGSTTVARAVPGASTLDLTLVLEPTPDVVVRVVDESGAPIEGISVIVWHGQAGWFNPRRGFVAPRTIARVNTDADGRADVPHRPGESFLIASDDDYFAIERVSLEGASKIELRCDPLGEVRLELSSHIGSAARLRFEPDQDLPLELGFVEVSAEHEGGTIGEIAIKVPAGSGQVVVELLELGRDGGADDGEVILVSDHTGARRRYVVVGEVARRYAVEPGASADLGEF